RRAGRAREGGGGVCRARPPLAAQIRSRHVGGRPVVAGVHADGGPCGDRRRRRGGGRTRRRLDGVAAPGRPRPGGAGGALGGPAAHARPDHDGVEGTGLWVVVRVSTRRVISSSWRYGSTPISQRARAMSTW